MLFRWSPSFIKSSSVIILSLYVSQYNSVLKFISEKQKHYKVAGIHTSIIDAKVKKKLWFSGKLMFSLLKLGTDLIYSYV